MKLKLLIMPLSLLLIVLGSTNAMAEGTTTIQALNPNGIWEGLFFTLVVLVLLLLVVWLLKNSSLLTKTAAADEKDGKQWLGSNLKNLDSQQLETLIRRGNSLKKNAGNR